MGFVLELRVMQGGEVLVTKLNPVSCLPEQVVQQLDHKIEQCNATLSSRLSDESEDPVHPMSPG